MCSLCVQESPLNSAHLYETAILVCFESRLDQSLISFFRNDFCAIKLSSTQGLFKRAR